MKDYRREYPLFSLCGLNCGLCPMHHMKNSCPGCGGGEGHQKCAIVTCSLSRGEMEFCYECEEFPCKRYANETSEQPFDSFILHRNVMKDFAKAKGTGLDIYKFELNEKVNILEWLLDHFNDGRRKSFFCTAVNLLELDDIKYVAEQIKQQVKPDESMKVKALLAVDVFKMMAAKRNISLKLNKKKS